MKAAFEKIKAGLEDAIAQTDGTAHLLSSPRNARRLLEAITSLNKSPVCEKGHSE